MGGKDWGITAAALMFIAGGILTLIGAILGLSGIDPNAEGTPKRDQITCGSAWFPNYDMGEDVLTPDPATFLASCQPRVENRQRVSLTFAGVGVVVMALSVSSMSARLDS